ncbi:CBN-SRB-15 protein [Aphelenchoides avenae]|nr:CBN-SRB-15 protein [Aphelenchus avenae]
MSVNVSVCAEAEGYAYDAVLKLVLMPDVIISISTLALLVALVKKPEFRSMPVHPNLKILLANVLVSYAMLSTILAVGLSRVLIMFHTYRESCDLVVPPWLTAIVRGASFSYSSAFPMWHLALTLERLMATQRAKKYETTGVVFGIIASVLVWTISTGHTSFIVWTAYQDEGFRTGSAYLTLYTRTSSSLITVRTYTIIVLDCGTLVLDGIIAVVNRRILKRTSTEYSLSRSYQIGENVAVTMRLILPWDVCNASLFLVSKVADSLFRQTGLFGMSHVRQQAFLDLCFMVTLLQLPFSLLILLRFCQKLKRNVVIVDPKSGTEVFFQQFQKQINAAAETQRRSTGWRRQNLA